MKTWLLLVTVVVMGSVSAFAGTFTDALEKSLVQDVNGHLKKVPPGSLADKKVIALYYSAHWCPPCRAFTPKLVEEYKELAAKYPQFQLIFVSSDYSEKDMLGYMEWAKMEWPALDYDKKEKIAAVKNLSAAGIPYLVVVDSDGKVLAGKAADQEWVSPEVILTKLKEILGKS